MSSLKPTCRLAFWLLLAVSLNVDTRDAAASPDEPPPLRDAQQHADKDAAVWERLILDRLKDGGLNYPEFPFVVTVEEVEGRRLHSIRYIRRDDSKAGYDMFGHARRGEFRIDPKNRQVLLQLDDGYYLLGEKGADCIHDQSRIWELDLPKDHAFLNKKAAESPAKAMDDLLSPTANKLLRLSWNDLQKELSPSTKSQCDVILEKAFGPDCPELSRPIRLHLSSRNMVWSASAFWLESDGSILMTSLSLVRWTGAVNEKTKFTTCRSERATLHLDQPVANLQQMSGRKILRIELADKTSLRFDDQEK